MSQNERHTICELAEGSHVTSTSLEIERQDDLTIYATDQLGFDQPICGVEIWEGELRVLVWQNDDKEPQIFPIRRLT
tara:strand:- start:4561 stop:4791 length:231 start_codon:yes stop_codon:yes gene_type:complete